MTMTIRIMRRRDKVALLLLLLLLKSIFSQINLRKRKWSRESARARASARQNKTGYFQFCQVIKLISAHLNGIRSERRKGNCLRVIAIRGPGTRSRRRRYPQSTVDTESECARTRSNTHVHISRLGKAFGGYHTTSGTQVTTVERHQ